MGFHSKKKNDCKCPGAAKCFVQGSLYRSQRATLTALIAGPGGPGICEQNTEPTPGLHGCPVR